jgi:hypothetical protein
LIPKIQGYTFDEKSCARIFGEVLDGTRRDEPDRRVREVIW